MTVIRKSEAPLFELPGLLVRGLASPQRGARETCVWHLQLLPGAEGTPHAVTREEIFVALAGRAVATIAGVSQELAAGDALVVPADEEFSLANRWSEPFEAIVSFPVGGRAVTSQATFTPPWAE